MTAVLSLALTAIMTYTAIFRKIYPGFIFLTVGQILWSLGIFFVFYRFLGVKTSLFFGNICLFLNAFFWYQGIARYGGMEKMFFRNAVNTAFFMLCGGLFYYYTYSEFDTCKRILVFSAFFSIMYFRIALEPYFSRRWRTYSPQAIFATMLCVYAIGYGIRFLVNLHVIECPLGGFGGTARVMLVFSTFFFPLVTFSLLSMTSGRVEAELHETHDALQLLAQTDALTGVSNRRHFLDLAHRALERARLEGSVVSFLMLDLDYFKVINDTYGHQVGDVVLRETARCLRETLRPPDLVGRLGGEEFGILLPGLDQVAALQVAERLRQAVAELHPGGYAITGSLGVATGCDSVDALVGRADGRLYAAKRTGRNRVLCADDRICPSEDDDASVLENA